MVAPRKNESEMLEAKEVRSKAAVIKAVEDHSELAAITLQMAYMMTVLDMKNSTSSNQRNKEGQKNKGNGSGNKGPDNKNRNGVNRNNGSSGNQNQAQGNSRICSKLCMLIGLEHSRFDRFHNRRLRNCCV